MRIDKISNLTPINFTYYNNISSNQQPQRMEAMQLPTQKSSTSQLSLIDMANVINNSETQMPKIIVKNEMAFDSLFFKHSIEEGLLNGRIVLNENEIRILNFTDKNGENLRIKLSLKKEFGETRLYMEPLLDTSNNQKSVA